MDNSENQIYADIQKLIYYMIPEKCKYIKLYMSIIENPKRGKRGELFFYYMPKRVFRKTYINCYEVPKMFDVDQDEYLNLTSKLYNNMVKLNIMCREEGNYWTNVTIIIEGSICKFEYYYEDLLKSEFDSYERHVIWRERYLRIPPETKEEKEIFKRFLRSPESKVKPYVEVVPAIRQDVKNIVEYEKVLTIDEALARGTDDENMEYVGKAIPPSARNKKAVKRKKNRNTNILNFNKKPKIFKDDKNNTNNNIQTNYDGNFFVGNKMDDILFGEFSYDEDIDNIENLDNIDDLF